MRGIFVPRGGYAAPGRITRTQHDYSGDLQYPDRRVSVNPYALSLSTYMLSLEAKGVLLVVFCRYWSNAVAPRCEVVRLSHRPLSRKKFERLLGELRDAGVVERRGERLHPAGPFAADPDRGEVQRSETRDMPSDWMAIRQSVFERDGYGCVYCGSGRDLHCDHVHPVALGGGHDTDNLVTACASCNLSKGSKTVAEWRPDIAERFKR